MIESIEHNNDLLSLESDGEAIYAEAGQPSGGTYVCRELALLYAAWCDPRYYIYMARISSSAGSCTLDESREKSAPILSMKWVKRKRPKGNAFNNTRTKSPKPHTTGDADDWLNLI